MRNRILIVLAVVFAVGLGLYFAGIRMTRSDLHISAAAEPLLCIGGERVGEFCNAATIFPITNALVMTLIIDVLLIGIAFVVGRNLQMVPRGLQNVVEAVVEGFYNFVKGVDAKNAAKFFPIPMTILAFFLLANILALTPGVVSIGSCAPKVKEETALIATSGVAYAAPALAPVAAETTPGEPSGPTALLAQLPFACPGDSFIIPYLRAPAADLNVTIAFALVAFFSIEYFGIQALGFGRYVGKFFENGPIVGILEILSEFIRIISFSFRIFGNIFGGEVILIVMAFLFPFVLPLPFYFFETFVALMQAAIFAVLTLIFYSIAVQAHGGHEKEEHAH